MPERLQGLARGGRRRRDAAGGRAPRATPSAGHLHQLPRFSREPTSPSIDAALKSMPPKHGGWKTVLDHRNGLILYGSCTAGTVSSATTTMRVCNPATRRWTALPPRPTGGNVVAYLVFDPTASLHYDVLCFPEEPDHASWPSLGTNHNTDKVDHLGSVEWPPSSYTVQVFASKTGRWEDRRFVREGDTTFTLLDVWSDPWRPRSGRPPYSYSSPRCHGVYWREKFYLHCRGGFIMRYVPVLCIPCYKDIIILLSSYLA